MDYVVQIDWLKHSTAEAIDDGTGKLIEIVYYIIIPNSQATIGYWGQHVLNTKYFFNLGARFNYFWLLVFILGLDSTVLWCIW